MIIIEVFEKKQTMRVHLRIVFGGFEESFLKIFIASQKRIIIIKNQDTHAFMRVMDSSSPSTLISHPGARVKEPNVIE